MSTDKEWGTIDPDLLNLEIKNYLNPQGKIIPVCVIGEADSRLGIDGELIPMMKVRKITADPMSTFDVDANLLSEI